GQTVKPTRLTQFGPMEIEKALNLDGTEGLRRTRLRPLLRKSFCRRKGIEPPFCKSSPRSCAKMWQSEIESWLGRIGIQHEPSRQPSDTCGIEPAIRRPLGLDYSDQRFCLLSPAEQFQQ